MNKVFVAIIVGVAYACAPAQNETVSNDTTAVELDTVAIATDDEVIEDAEMYDADPGEVRTGDLDGDEYVITNQGSYVSNPFTFSLDSTTVQELLGENAVISPTIVEGGEDEMGPYDGYTYYEASLGKTKLNFYSYSGKHHAEIYTPALELQNGVKVGMSKQEFVEAMGLDDEALEANTFTINDDFGSMSFYFEDDKLNHIYIHYEEGD